MDRPIYWVYHLFLISKPDLKIIKSHRGYVRSNGSEHILINVAGLSDELLLKYGVFNDN